LIEKSEGGVPHVAEQIKEICLRLLTQREHSQKELLDKLALRGFGRDDVQPVIDELAEQDWQDDSRYAENYARFRIRKGYGPIRVGYELKQNGIAAFDLECIVKEEAGSWTVLLAQVYSKKYLHDTALDRNEWAKRSRFLLHRGFSGAMISALFDELDIRFL
jgi:regulatory protein